MKVKVITYFGDEKVNYNEGELINPPKGSDYPYSLKSNNGISPVYSKREEFNTKKALGGGLSAFPIEEIYELVVPLCKDSLTH